jgi:hypothetical protein
MTGRETFVIITTPDGIADGNGLFVIDNIIERQQRILDEILVLQREQKKSLDRLMTGSD